MQIPVIKLRRVDCIFPLTEQFKTQNQINAKFKTKLGKIRVLPHSSLKENIRKTGVWMPSRGCGLWEYKEWVKETLENSTEEGVPSYSEDAQCKVF